MKEISVRIATILLSLLVFGSNAYSQNSVSELIDRFKQIDLPIKDISNIITYDSLDNALLNSYLFPCDGKKTIIPKVISAKGNLIRHTYTGRYPEKNEVFGFGGKNHSYHDRIDVIGKVTLSSNFESIIIRIESTESIFYDIWNVDKLTLKPVSQICLFYGFKESWHKTTIDYVEVESDITQEGTIVWHSNQRGLHTYRTYRVNEDGYFQVIEERKEGEFDY